MSGHTCLMSGSLHVHQGVLAHHLRDHRAHAAGPGFREYLGVLEARLAHLRIVDEVADTGQVHHGAEMTDRLNEEEGREVVGGIDEEFVQYGARLATSG